MKLRIPYGRWLIRGTDDCTCDHRCPTHWCIDAGRVDREKLPATCCANRISAEQVQRDREAYRIRKIQEGR